MRPFLLRFFLVVLIFSCNPAFSETVSEKINSDVKPPPVTKITPNMPFDVDRILLAKLMAQDQKSQAQQLFDNFSWTTFLAVNWPASQNGEADRNKGLSDSQTPRVWEFYREASSIFLDQGEKPEPWSGSSYWKKVSNQASTERNLWMTNATGKPSHDVANLNESLQAFSGPLVDQNGNWVRYEVLVNETEFDYIFRNQLYNLDGQAAYTAKNKIDFPPNDGTKRYGSMEIKLAWKQLGPHDDPKRFLVRKAKVTHIIADKNGNLVPAEPTMETMGLVGMHIAGAHRPPPPGFGPPSSRLIM